MQLYEVLLRLKEDVEGSNPSQTKTIKLSISELLKDLGVTKIEATLSNGLLSNLKLYGSSDILFLADAYCRNISFNHSLTLSISSIGRSVWETGVLDYYFLGKFDLRLSSTVKKSLSNLCPFDCDVYTLEECNGLRIDFSVLLSRLKYLNLHFSSMRLTFKSLNGRLGEVLRSFISNSSNLYKYIDYIYLNLDFLDFERFTVLESDKVLYESIFNEFKSKFNPMSFCLEFSVRSNTDIDVEKLMTRYKSPVLTKTPSKVGFRYNLFRIVQNVLPLAYYSFIRD